MRLLTSIALLLAVTFLAGCNTFERRARQRADVFATLTPETQARLEQKVIHVGDTSDMVYIALGAPDEKRTVASTTGEITEWTYNRYWQEYRGEAFDGFHRHVVRDPKTGATSVYFEPISRPVYAERQQPILRIQFANDRVAVIEKADD